MSSPPASPMPDFDQMAAKFDRFLPLIQPVALAVLDKLPAQGRGAAVLDVACGTGEPGLTLARRSPDIHLLGVDSAPRMIDVAKAKSARESLANARFEVMSSDALTLADESVDAVISRFGLIMFGDVPASARELVRVLKKGGRFSVAVWDDMAKNTLVHSLDRVLRDYLPPDEESPLKQLQAWAAEGRRAELLSSVGLRAVRSEMFSWMYEFGSFEEPWDLLTGMGMLNRQKALSEEDRANVRRDLEQALSPYREPSGGYRIPHACRLFWGER